MAEAGTGTALTKAGRPRKTRPDGSYYSSDPSERHRQLEEDGKIGGHFGRLGGRPRKPRAGKALADHAKERAEELKSVFDDAFASDNIRIRMKAANDLVEIERKEDQLQIDEDKLENASREELEEAVIALLEDPQLSAALGVEITVEEEVVDAEPLP